MARAKVTKTTSKAKPVATAKRAAKTKPAAKTAELKTKATPASVDAFIASLPPPRDEECRALATMMTKATGAAAKMWGKSIVGFGDWHYKYESGREGDFFLVGFSPRKAALTIYINGGYEKHGELLAKLGKHSLGKACLYVKTLADIDRKVLATLVDRGVKDLKSRA
jgi:hypothetical protein